MIINLFVVDREALMLGTTVEEIWGKTKYSHIYNRIKMALYVTQSLQGRFMPFWSIKFVTLRHIRGKLK